MRTLRVLIVDDDAVISELLAETLEAIGHVVCGIETTEEGAVSAAALCQPDLMIVDVRLGEGSGIRAMEQILRSAPTPHVFITGERLRRSSEMLQKPFRTAELVQAMQRVLAAASR
jgi:two-component system, response regulator PdtaR